MVIVKWVSLRKTLTIFQRDFGAKKRLFSQKAIKRRLSVAKLICRYNRT